MADTELAARIRETGVSHRLSVIASRIRAAKESASVAVRNDIDGQPPLKRLRDVSVGPTHLMVVLDSRTYRVGTVDEGGVVRGLPIEEQSLAHTSKITSALQLRDGIVVLVNQAGETEILHRTPAGSYQRTAHLSVGGRPEDICNLGDELYVRAPNDRALIMRIGSSGQVIGTVGTPYRAKAKNVQSFLSQGSIACIPGSRMVIAMFAAFPELYGYAPDGTLRWVSRFEDFKRPRLIEVAHPTHAQLLHAQPDVADRLAELIEFESQYLIVQFRRWSPDTAKQPHEIHTYVVEATTGHGEYIGQSLPLLRGSRASKLYADVEKPFLRLVTYTVGE